MASRDTFPLNGRSSASRGSLMVPSMQTALPSMFGVNRMLWPSLESFTVYLGQSNRSDSIVIDDVRRTTPVTWGAGLAGWAGALRADSSADSSSATLVPAVSASERAFSRSLRSEPFSDSRASTLSLSSSTFGSSAEDSPPWPF